MKKNLILLVPLLFFAGCQKSNDSVLTFSAMNTVMNVKVYGQNSKIAANEVQHRINELEAELSATLENSDVWKINNSCGEEITVCNDVLKIIEYSLKFAETTDGGLNPCLYPVIKEWGFTTGDYKVPDAEKIKELLQYCDYKKVLVDGNVIKTEKNMMMDFGALGKGYAGDEAVKVLKANGITSALLDLGGNIQVLGSKPDGSAWNVGIKNPWGGQSVAGVKISDKVVITSGGYERFFEAKDGHRYIHIFDGKTGYPVENDILSVSIITDSGLYGDALSTTLLVLGKDAAVEFWKARRDFDFVMILNDDSVIYSKPLNSTLTLLHDFKNISVVE